MSLFPIVHVTDVRALTDCHVWVRFRDGVERTINLWPFIAEGLIYQEVRDLTVFEQVYISDCTVAWPNGADIDPLVLRYYPELYPAGWDMQELPANN